MQFNVCLFSQKGEEERLGFFLLHDENNRAVKGLFFFEEFKGTCNKVCPKGQSAIAHREISPDNFFFPGCDFSVEVNNPLMWTLSNGKFNTLLGHCYIEKLYRVRHPAILNQHNFIENTPTEPHCSTVVKGLDTNLPETKHTTKITLLSIPRKSSIYRYFEYTGGGQYLFSFLTHESPLFFMQFSFSEGA